MTAVEYDIEEEFFQATYDENSELATLAVVAVIDSTNGTMKHGSTSFDDE
ncbi:hypothetical protein [Natronosalvus caseinilyticus]|nr:hypothetical protein [Natronosalvus caseinilyticus]